MKKIKLSLLLWLIPFSFCNAENDLTPGAKSAIMMDQNTHTVLYEKNANEKRPPASMTKVMSMLLVMDQIEKGNLSMDDEVTISENASSMGGSQVFLNPGETYVVRELLKAVAVSSANDAVVALAEKVAGSVDEFVQMMNQKASDLGLTDTHFMNPHGLDTDNHYTTAHDMILMASELIKYESILDFTSIYEDYLKKNDGSSIWLVNTNKLVRFYDGVDGLKTGYTKNAMYCLTATAKKSNLRLITVVMGEDSSDQRSSDTVNLLNYGFNTYKNEVLLSHEQSLGLKRVENSSLDQINIYLKKDYAKLLKINAPHPEYSYQLKVGQLVAPILKNSSVGQIDVLDLNGSVVDTLDVTIHEDLKKLNVLSLMWLNLKRITTGKVIIH